MHLRRGGNVLEVFLIAVSLAVAAVPEGLPAVVTLALALGLQRMVKRHALVRKLPSVETLGSVTVICSDKTGTLTRNEMTARTVIAGRDEYKITGTGYQPQGTLELANSGQQSKPLEPSGHSPALRLLLTIADRCNNAKLVPPAGENEPWKVIGDPTEGALLTLARKGGLDAAATHHLVEEIPFDSQRKAMSVVIREADQSLAMYTKGAPEIILPLCQHERLGDNDEPLTEARRREILDRCAKLADRALRVLALAYRPISSDQGPFAEEQLVFVGLVGLIDPPRDEAKLAISLCTTAGIRPIMITGDHPATAQAIATELGLLTPGQRVLSGQEIEKLSDAALEQQVIDVGVYARVSAEHKLRIVRAWRKRGQVVAMTGDGVNDAPAIKAADIGIAMGIAGTDVTKDASDMVLMDDNFRSIVNAVEEGRSIFDNIQNVVSYLLSCNAGEVLFMFFATLAGWPIPLTAIEILWINLVTDGLPALALAMEPPDRDVMQRPPRPPHEPVITRQRGALILIQGALIAAATSFGFWYAYRGEEAAFGQARTIAFCILAYSQLFFSFSCRSIHYTLPQLGLFTNPHLLAAILLSGLLQFGVVMLPFAQHIFDATPLPTSSWLLILLASLAPVTLVELTKLALAIRRRSPLPVGEG